MPKQRSPFKFNFIDDDEGVPRMLKNLTILCIIINCLYYFTGPGKVVFFAEDSGKCNFDAPDPDTFYYQPDYSDGNQTAVMEQYMTINLKSQADKTLRFSEGG